MIFGTGTDLIEVARVAEKAGKTSGFKELVFSASEIAYCESKTHQYEHFAARFAAKEAFFKAIGTGWRNGTAFNEVEILNDEQGKPYINLLAKTKDSMEALGIGKISVSLSHLTTIASAIVIIETK